VPVLHLPLRPGGETLAVSLGVRMCWQHRLPRRGWFGLRDPAVLDALRRIAAPRSFAIDDAWIEHVPATLTHGDDPE
jgi:hypothetical protein